MPQGLRDRADVAVKKEPTLGGASSSEESSSLELELEAGGGGAGAAFLDLDDLLYICKKKKKLIRSKFCA